MSDLQNDYQDIREAVRDLCAQFPSKYFRKIDEERGYAEAFVDALTQADWLAALILKEYGGSGLGLTEASVIMEEINRRGGNSVACHDQMYNMGTLMRHGSEEQKRSYHAGHRQRRATLAIHWGSLSPAPALTPPRSKPRRYGVATATSSTAKKSGSPASSIPT